MTYTFNRMITDTDIDTIDARIHTAPAVKAA